LARFLADYGFLFGSLIFLLVYFGLTTENHAFLSLYNLEAIPLQSAVYMVLAVGMTPVILTGGIDLSVGSILALTGVMAADTLRNGLILHGVTLIPKLPPVPATWAAIGVALLLGLLLGAVNGALIAKAGVTPFIVTLATMTILRGAGYIHTVSPIGSLPDTFNHIGGGKGNQIFGLDYPVWIAALVALLAHLALTRTAFGRHIYAIGGSEEAARLSGVPVARTKMLVYAFMGLLAGLAGVLQTARLYSGSPKAGEQYELSAIAAVVLGGASLQGGRGGIPGTLLGVLVVGVLNNGLSYQGANQFYTMVASGVFILLAVLLDRIRRQASGVRSSVH
jgi:ribose transport system permease protein